jgi:hypothetical protein
LELGVRSQEPGEKRKKEEGRSQKKCFYKYEMLPDRELRSSAEAGQSAQSKSEGGGT